MPRPKGSKNKKTLEAEAHLGDRIAEELQKKKQLEKEMNKLCREIDDRNERLKQVKKQLRRSARTIEDLTAKKADVDAANASALRQEEMRQLVNTLLDSGLSTDEILKKLG